MPERTLEGLTVLVVDDDVAHREALAESLGGVGAAVVEAADGKGGLARIGLSLPDVVVADLRMPGMDGLEMTARLRRNLIAVPVVLTTAYGDAASLARAIELGGDGFVALSPFAEGAADDPSRVSAAAAAVCAPAKHKPNANAAAPTRAAFSWVIQTSVLSRWGTGAGIGQSCPACDGC